MKKLKETTNEGAVVVHTKEELQLKMKQTIKEIDKKLAKITQSNAYYKASGAFKLNENDSNNVNIQSTIDLMYLIKSLSFVERIDREYTETAEALNLDKYPICTWLNSDIKLWIHDLKLRISILTNQDLLNKLTVSRNKLTAFLTEEDRLAQTLTEISDLIN